MEKAMWSKRKAWLIFSHILYDVINGIKKIKENMRKIMVRPNGQEGRWGGSFPNLIFTVVSVPNEKRRRK